MPEQAVEPRASTVVVTGENRAEFMSRKLEIAAPVKAEAAPVKEVVKEPEAKLEPEKGGPKVDDAKKEKKEGINERFSELTHQRKEAEARETKERERAEKAEKRAAELEAKLAPAPAPKDEGEPKRDSYASDDEYATAVIDHRVEKKLAERDKTQREAAERVEQEKLADSWKSRVVELKKEVPDYDDIIGASQVKVHNAVRDAIFESEAGPRILIHIAQTDGEAERLAKMTVTRAVKEIGKLEDKFLKKPEPKAEQKQEPKKEVEISKAPAPITPLKGASSPVELPIDAKGEWTGTYKQFKEAVNAGKIK